MNNIFKVSLTVLVTAVPVLSLAQDSATIDEPSVTAEAQICTAVEERIPVGTAATYTADVERLYLWCRVTGAVDTTVVSHLWLYEGKEMATVELPVRSASWRTWSSKTILPEWTGQWEVRVLDTDGEVLSSTSFTIDIAPEVETAAPADTGQSSDSL
ncbi:MAG: DUF2914 domain-containing protein [bacterium]